MRDNTLRVLHLGNVANNAYLNAKLLASRVDSDVLSYAHYHIMGSPEWEDSDFAGHVDEFHPDWRQVDLRGFRRPEWFAEGPLASAASYLGARRNGHATAMMARAWLDLRRDLICGRRWAPVRRLRQRLRQRAGSVDTWSVDPSGRPTPTHQRRQPVPELITRFRERFPDRDDQLTGADIESVMRAHRCGVSGLRRLFSNYDLVHAYGAEPVLPLVAGSRPYIAFEHGTIRELPFEDSPLGRLTALAYREADAVVITNADNRIAAARLGISRYAFVPHPVNEQQLSSAAVAELRRQLHQQLNADFIVFHPSRHHWSRNRNSHLEKGNNHVIEGLARLVAQRPRAAAVFVNWGATLDASRRLVASLGIRDRVFWIDPVPGPALARYMAAADVVADQFHLGAFGAITPRALFLGTPALLFLDEDAHRWCFSEPPPVLNARDAGSIADRLIVAYDDRGALRGLGARGQEWYQRHHSNDVVRRSLLDIYGRVIAAGRGSSTPDAEPLFL